MTDLSSWRLLFAQQGARVQIDWSEISRSAENRPIGALSLIMGILFLALFGGIVAFAILNRRREQQENLDDHRAMFDELCNAHKLESDQRSLLFELARCQRLVDPDYLFVRPDLFDEAAQKLASEPRARGLDRIPVLREILFGATLTPTN